MRGALQEGIFWLKRLLVDSSAWILLFEGGRIVAFRIPLIIRVGQYLRQSHSPVEPLAEAEVVQVEGL